MKRVLYAISGFCWGIFLFNKEILWYAIFVSTLSILIDVLVDDK